MSLPSKVTVTTTTTDATSWWAGATAAIGVVSGLLGTAVGFMIHRHMSSELYNLSFS